MLKLADKSRIAKLVRKILFESRFTEFMSESVFVWVFSEMPQSVFFSPVSLVSAYVLPAGLIMFACSFGSVFEMILSAAIIVFAVLILGIKTTLSSLIDNSFIFRRFFNYFEIDYKTEPTKKYKKRFYAVTIIFGIIVGALSYFVSFKLSLIIFVGVLLLPVLISSPLLIAFLMFFCGMIFSSMPAFVLCLLSVLVVICRLIKKIDKMPKFRSATVLVFLYLAITLFYTFFGIGGSDGLLAGTVQSVFILSLFVITVIVNNLERLKKVIYLLSFSTIVPCLIGVYQFLSGQGGTGWTSELYVGGLARITSTFMNPNVYGEFLIFAISVCLVAIFMSSDLKSRFAFCGILALQFVNLALTYSRGCYISVFAIILVIIWMCDKRLLGFGIFAIPFLPYVLPRNIISRLMSIGSYLNDGSVTYRFSIWKGALSVIANHWFEGTGIGTVAFMLRYNNYMVSGTPAQHAHNMFLQIAIELSVFALIVFLLIFLFCIRDVSNVVKRTEHKSKFILIPLIACFGGVFIQGLFDYIFYNNIIFLTFWMVLGLLISALNIISSDKSFLKK